MCPLDTDAPTFHLSTSKIFFPELCDKQRPPLRGSIKMILFRINNVLPMC